jgi:MoaA/NifB/PqqE/SkfB family radical SAM enzyme
MEKRDFGGVPLLSRDILEIAKSLKTPSSKPYLIFATSGRILNDKLYLGLKKAGVDRFSIALDFPDERHDAFRESPGLFRHLSKLVPKLTSFGGSDIVLTSTITKYNLRSLLDIYNRALEWNANVSFSAYTPLRTGRMEHFINSPDELVILRETIHELMRLKKSGDRIVNSDWALAGTYSQFSDREQMPGCTTGKKFLTVQPDQGIPLLEKFTAPSTCDSCFEAIRACLCEHYWASKWDNVSREIFRKNGTKSSS